MATNSPSSKDISDQLCRDADVCLSLEAKQRIRQRLLSEYQEQKYHCPQLSVPPRMRFRTAPVIIFAVVIVVVGTGVGTVAAANDARPGDRLFVVDRAVERVQLAITPNKSQRAKLLADIAKERSQEHDQLVSEQKVSAAQEAERLTIVAVNQALTTNDAARAELIEQAAITEVADLNHVRNEVASFDATLPQLANAGLTGAVAKFDNNITTITLKLNAATATFQLQTQNIAEIEQAIVQRTGIDLQQLKSMLVIKPADTIAPPTTEEPLPNAGNSNTNTNSTIDGQPVSNTNTLTPTNNMNSAIPPPLDNDPVVPAGWDINVTTQDGSANIGISKNDLALFAWTMPTTDVDLIIASIGQKTGLTSEQIRALWHLETE